MGFIDPMTIQNAAATGGLDFSSGAAIWLSAMGMLTAGFAGLLLVEVRDWRSWRRLLPRLGAPAPHAALAGRTR
jgi:hypothetical protein